MIDCPKGTERDLAALYLAGKLGEEEAVAFEEHFFACASCREEVERSSELRAVLGKAPIVAAIRPARSGRTWFPLAAAAAIAFVGIGVWQFTRRAPQQPAVSVLRSVSDAFDVHIEAGSQGSLDLRWPEHASAAIYKVEVFASDGVTVWQTETREPHVGIAAGVLPAPQRGRSYEVKVEAFDSLGQQVAMSVPTELPKP